MLMEKNLNLIFLAIFCLITASCDGDGSYQAETYFENRTGHKIAIQPFSNGVLLNEGLRILAIDEVKLVYENRGRGVGGPSFGVMAVDSVVVTFDDTLNVLHLGLNKHIRPKSYTYDHLRNLTNNTNYNELISESKKFIEREYRYIFTVADYQSALELNK